MTRCLLMVFGILISGCTVSPRARSHECWPRVQTATYDVHFTDDDAREARIGILGTNGLPLYSLECHLNAYELEDPDFWYSGAFECRLVPLYSEESYAGIIVTQTANLLQNRRCRARDWEHAGRFLHEDLAMAVADRIVRRCRLRGMALTFEVGNVSMLSNSAAHNWPWEVERVGELDLRLTVTPAPEALSDICAQLGKEE